MPNRRSRDFSHFEDPGPIYRLSALPEALRGPLVMATLAYPEAKYSGRRVEIALKLSVRELMQSLDRPTDWLPGPNGVAIPVDVRRAKAGSKQLELRLRRRMELGRLVLKPILAAESGQLPLRTWGGRWNRAEEVRETLVATGGDARNFERDYWRTALPVAHLAAGWYATMLARGKRGETHNIFQQMNDVSFRDELLRRAQMLEGLVESSDLKIPSSILIKFRR